MTSALRSDWLVGLQGIVVLGLSVLQLTCKPLLLGILSHMHDVRQPRNLLRLEPIAKHKRSFNNFKAPKFGLNSQP